MNFTCDVVVVGGGVTGVAAGIAAARNGAKVILLEPRPFVGGNATTGLCLHNFVDKFGNRVDAQGEYVVESKPFLDDDGNPVVSDEEIQSQTTPVPDAETKEEPTAPKADVEVPKT
jgi:flavin-dependent dehydrogenase